MRGGGEVLSDSKLPELKVTWVGQYSVRLDNGTCWPRLGHKGPEDYDSIEYTMRYGTAEKLRNLSCYAAEYISAYKRLVDMPRAKRERVIMALRSAEEEEE